MKKPVILLIFNRPELTSAIINRVKKYQPEKLLVVADGPRLGNLEDEVNCTNTLRLVNPSEWSCEVLFNISPINLGCKKRILTGLDWAFSIADEAIILEDDCLPSEDFFRFCEFGLSHYKKNNDVWAITGNNFQNEKLIDDQAFYFSKYLHVWGWATWSDRWKSIDPDLYFLDSWVKSRAFVEVCNSKKEQIFWLKLFQRTRADLIDTWDHIVTANIWFMGTKILTPYVNLVENIGFSESATHTKYDYNSMHRCARKLDLQLKYYEQTDIDRKKDKYIFNAYYNLPIAKRILNKLKHVYK